MNLNCNVMCGKLEYERGELLEKRISIIKQWRGVMQLIKIGLHIYL